MNVASLSAAERGSSTRANPSAHADTRSSSRGRQGAPRGDGESATNGANLGDQTIKIANTIAEVAVGMKDTRGVLIEHVYFKRVNYAIYGCGPQVLVAHSDDQAVADKQIVAIAGLLPLRDHLINLTKNLPLANAKECYATQMADALRLALEGQADWAKAIIDEAVRDALEIQARIGRMVYLKWAFGIAFLFAALLISMGALMEDKTGVHFLLLATGAGAVGALLSISIGIRGRSVAIDGNWQANATDAAVRVLIGVTSAGIFFLFLTSGVVLTALQVGKIALTGDQIAWQAVMLVGFVAGFFERLVPDLLEKSVDPRADSPSPANKTGVVSPPGAGRP